MAKITLLKVGAKWCAPCVAMDKRGTLDKFQERHPDVKVEVHDDTETGSAAWERFADSWKVRATPSFIWTYKGDELFRSSGGKSLAELEIEYQRAVQKVEKLS